MPRLECNSLFEGCEAVVEADTIEEILAQATAHAATAHGVTEPNDATVEAVRDAIVW